nr:molybdenum cofactor sulfurase [Quercus suber]
MDYAPQFVDPAKVADMSHSVQLRSSRSMVSMISACSRVAGSPYLNAVSSVEDTSTTSTDCTTPSNGESCHGDMQTDDVDAFREREYPQLIGKTYLDHGGTTLYAKSLIEDFSADLISNLYGNPHSASTPSALSGHRVDNIRTRALRFFGADPNEFDLVFTNNATGAIKLVIDCFKDHASASNTPVWYGYHRDAHTSLVGVREATKMNRCFTSDEEVDIWINSGGLGGPRARQLGLFAYPGQSNMTGRRLPLNWPGRIRKSFHKALTYTLLDAAALSSTAPLDLSDPVTAPDFVALSFYKIFGFPNIGALIVRKDSAHVLESRKFFGGGTVDMVIAINDNWHAKKDTTIHDRLEDGTLPFHSIFALDHAISTHERLYGPNPMKFISRHTAHLSKQLYDGMVALKHSNGAPLCIIYKDDNAVYGDASVQGATIAFNVQNADRTLVGYEDVEEAADDRNIYVRSGSLCNPGGMASYLDWSPAEMKAAYAAGHRCSNPTQIMLGKPTGVVRVSLGAMSTSSDVMVFLNFLTNVYLNKPVHVARRSVSMHFEQSTKAARIFSVPPGLTTSLSDDPPTPVMPASPRSFSGTLPSSRINENSIWHHPRDAPIAQLPPHDAEKTGSPSSMHPPFIPADYVKLRKPWEEELRKGKYANVSTEIKVRELEESGSFSRNATPSVKARKFGRSVVNLLRNKTNLPNDDRQTMPPNSASPTLTTNGTESQRSRRSLERAHFARNVELMGM